MAEVSACFGHIVYGSQEVAANAATLHRIAYPSCGGIGPWECGDHWHIGHPTAYVGWRCKTDADHRRQRRRIERAMGRPRRTKHPS